MATFKTYQVTIELKSGFATLVDKDASITALEAFGFEVELYEDTDGDTLILNHEFESKMAPDQVEKTILEIVKMAASSAWKLAGFTFDAE